MSWLLENKDLNKTLEKLTLPYSWRDYAAWKLISELSRRSPGYFLIYECPYAGGMPGPVWYMNATISPEQRQGENVIRINSGGHVAHSGHFDSQTCAVTIGVKQDREFDSTATIFTNDFRGLRRDLEACVLPEPIHEKTPPTLANTIGQQVIAATLGLFLHTKHPLSVTGYLYDGYEKREDLFNKIEALKNIAKEDSSVDLDQLFFIREEKDTPSFHMDEDAGEPIVAIDLKLGRAYFGNHAVDLMSTYQEHGRDIDSLAFWLIKEARKK